MFGNIISTKGFSYKKTVKSVCVVIIYYAKRKLADEWIKVAGNSQRKFDCEQGDTN